MSSKPTMATSSGYLNLDSLSTDKAPEACTSHDTRIAVGLFLPSARNSRMSAAPDSLVNPSSLPGGLLLIKDADKGNPLSSIACLYPLNRCRAGKLWRFALSMPMRL